MSLKARRPQLISFKRMFIVPLVFLWFSLHSLLTNLEINSLRIGIWGLSLLLGTGLGFWQAYRLPIKIDKINQLIAFPGGWSTFILVMIIFGTKYYFGYTKATDPQLASSLPFELSLLACTAIISGFVIGRVTCYLYRWKTMPSIDLSVKANRQLDP
jgi:hypothetical protein